MHPKSPPTPPPAQDILDSVVAGIVALDRRQRITTINLAAAQIAGLEPEAALGRSCRQIFKSSLCDGQCPLLPVLDSGEAQYQREAVFIRQEGRSVVPAKVSASPLYDGDGRISGGVLSIQSYQLSELLQRPKGHEWDDFVGESPTVGRIFEVLKVVVPSQATILIEGPTGTGKDLIARIIHHNSPRANSPMVKVNCAALPENLLESEMFGYKRGAFTGADRDKPGRFEMADGGTILLDEISAMPLSLQAKLLRVIEEREFYPLGARKTSRVDVRILAACNNSLADQVKAGLFREDLYYRLNVIRLFIPPLRERREDLPLLIQRFIQRKNLERGNFICRFSPAALDCLLNHEYPGNVRELENILEHACLLCRGDVIREEHLPWGLREAVDAPAGPTPSVREEEQRRLVVQALEKAGWRRAEAASQLGIDRTTLWRRMKRYGVRPPR